jgi:NAD(P)H-hydrate epimerase
MAGAAVLCAKAAYRTGAGLVEVFTHESNRIILQTALPEAIVSTYSDELDENALLCSLEKADAVVIGCGLGITPTSRKLLATLLRANTENTPLVLDADALNLISRNPSLSKYMKGAIITPHFAEAARLLGCEIEGLMLSPEKAASELSSRFGAIAVMKDHETIVSDGGERAYRNNGGNSGMATGGSGDVLAGVIGGILSQSARSSLSLSKLDAASLGVYIHSLAGDIAAERLGEYSLIASDIIDALPLVLRGVNVQ